MMVDKVINSAHLYTDIQGLEELRSKVSSNPNMVAHEAAQQFESMLVQMLLKSMRDASKAFSSGLFNSDYMDYYQDFFDKQISMVVSQQGIGFAENIEANLSDTHAIRHATKPDHHEAEPKTLFSSAKEFVTGLWHEAKAAASKLNMSPALLLSQAALETDWGKKIIKHHDGESTKNLFNIKADHHWEKGTSQVTTLEQQDGMLVKQQAKFKSYASFAESFHDYVKLVTQNNRYKDTLNHSTNPKEYMQSLQHAGYATDPEYANKVLAIFNSKGMQNIVKSLK